MKLRRGSCVFACVVALMCSGQAYADSISAGDSRLSVGHDGNNCTSMIIPTFTVTVDMKGGGDNCFLNETGEDISKLVLMGTLTKNDNNINCDTVFFTACIVSCDTSAGASSHNHCKAGDTITITFSGGGGIPSGPPQGCPGGPNCFFIDLNTVHGTDGGGWGNGHGNEPGNGLQAFNVIPTVPEPGTFLLLLAGLGAVPLVRRLRWS